MKKALLVCCGYISLVLGIAGIFLPLLPTTPFLLLAAACFARGSKLHYTWLIHHKVFGRYIRAYRRFGAISVRAKILSLTLLWGCVLYSVFFVISHWWLRMALMLIATAVAIHLLRMNTLTREMAEVLKREGSIPQATPSEGSGTLPASPRQRPSERGGT